MMSRSGRKRSEPETITVKAVAFSAQIQEHDLKWEAPLGHLLKDPSTADFVWKRLQYVFDFEDPAAFPRVDVELAEEDLDACRRFIRHTRELAEASLMNAEEKVTIGIPDEGGPERVETEFSPKDVTTGFMVLFRQCYANDEDASFLSVVKLLGAALHEAGHEDLAKAFKQWRQANAKLRQKTLEELVQEQMVENGQIPADSVAADGMTQSMIVRPPDSPNNMLNQRWYGDQIHWGRHRDAVGVLEKDPMRSALADFEARQAAIDMTHLYLGFSVLLERALGLGEDGDGTGKAEPR